MRCLLVLVAFVLLAGCGREEIFPEPAIVARTPFTVLGRQFWIDPEQANYPDLWAKGYGPHEKPARALAVRTGHYGVFFARKEGKTGYMIGVEVKPDAQPPAELQLLKIPAARYAVFEFDSAHIPNAWDHVHGVWLRNSTEFKLAASPCFEYYPPGAFLGEGKMQIWVPVNPQ